MPLDVLFVVVVLGVAGVVWLVHSTGGSTVRRFADDADAARVWSFDHPSEQVETVILSKAGKAALIETDRGSGLLWSFEADAVSYPLLPASLRAVSEHPRGLRVELAEFHTPATVLELTGAEVAAWTAYLSRFVRR